MLSIFRFILFFVRNFASLFIFLLFLTSCSNEDLLKDVLDPTEPADQIYNQALANIEAGDIIEAIKKFNKVDRQHPYSPLARRSVIMVTYLSYRTGDYDQAISDGERFVSLYPSDDEAPYALYLVGMSHFRQLRDVTRDQQPASMTIQAMNEIITRYPDSDYVEDARRKLSIARDQLAAHEMFVGRYYQERREFTAAINRFRVVTDDYGSTRHVEEALARLVECYFSLGLLSQAHDTALLLGHNYPDSAWYDYAYALLSSDGSIASIGDRSFLTSFTNFLGLTTSDYTIGIDDSTDENGPSWLSRLFGDDVAEDSETTATANGDADTTATANDATTTDQ